MPPTPTTQSCDVESMAKKVVILQDCHRTAACVLCTLSGLTCDQIVATAQIHDGFAVPNRQVNIVRRNDAGFAG